MNGPGAELLDEGQRALAAGEWSVARAAFEAALDCEETAEARFGLGVALWWIGETVESVRCQERAYVAFRRRPDPVQAVNAAVYLCLVYSASLGNYAVSRGWLGRAASLVEQFELPSLEGWVLLCRAVAAHDRGDLQEAERWARKAHGCARSHPDVDLELCAMGELGAVLVESGRIEEGGALVDEAMAGAFSGEMDNLDSVVLACCRTITSCSRAGEVGRVVQWIRAADAFNRRYGSPHLYTRCRVHLGNVLFANGQWAEADRELRSALQIGEAAEPALYAEALAKLAELRLAQGRLDEAGRLIAGYEDHLATAYPAGALYVARGESLVAASMLRRRLRESDATGVVGAALLELLVEAEVARGEVPEPAPAGQLAALGASLGCDPMIARGERALGRIALGSADVERAARHFEQALVAFGRLEMPFEAARTRALLATALAGAEPETAIAEARVALDGFRRLGAARDADAAAAFLRSLGVKVVHAAAVGRGGLTRREIEVLELLGDGLSNNAIAERLFISRKTVEHHVASVLSKLGLSSRGAAAGYAVRHPRRGSAAE